jgi:hypothetical protein
MNRSTFDDSGYVVLDAELMESLRLEKGVSRRQFAELAGVSPTTAYRFFQGERIQTRIARRLFDCLGVVDMKPYLRTCDSAEGEFGALDTEVLTEWRVENVMSQPVTLSNGLQFQICRLAHQVLPNTWGRGKCYDLRQLTTRDSQRVKEQLLRHPVVCRKVGPHARFPINERVLYSDDHSRFWVIDRWIDGITLADKLRYGRLPPRLLPVVMRQILEGLEALHGCEIIRRELSPAYITLVEPHADVLFTELELAKLLEGGISVSETWDEDPYRAPEIENDEIDATVDLYSWAQVFVHALTGKRPPSPANPKLLDEAGLPSAVRAITQRCLSMSHKWRPNSAEQVLKAVRDWK